MFKKVGKTVVDYRKHEEIILKLDREQKALEERWRCANIAAQRETPLQSLNTDGPVRNSESLTLEQKEVLKLKAEKAMRKMRKTQIKTKTTWLLLLDRGHQSGEAFDLNIIPHTWLGPTMRLVRKSADRSLAKMLQRAWSGLAVFICNARPKTHQVRARVAWIRFAGLLTMDPLEEPSLEDWFSATINKWHQMSEYNCPFTNKELKYYWYFAQDCIFGGTITSAKEISYDEFSALVWSFKRETSCREMTRLYLQKQF